MSVNLVVDCDAEGRKGSGIKRTPRQGRGSPVKNGAQHCTTNKSSGRQKSARFRADVKVTAAAAIINISDGSNSCFGLEVAVTTINTRIITLISALNGS